MVVYVLPKWTDRNLCKGIVVDTTSSTSTKYRELSPFILGPISTYLPDLFSKNFENLWQYSKVYPTQVDERGQPTITWLQWRLNGWNNPRAVRYPMGKGAKPLYSYWDGLKMGYIEARKKIYAKKYSENVVKTKSFRNLFSLYEEACSKGSDITLLDYDAYDYINKGMSLKDVINYPSLKMGHAFVLAMTLTGVLDKCLE